MLTCVILTTISCPTQELLHLRWQLSHAQNHGTMMDSSVIHIQSIRQSSWLYHHKTSRIQPLLTIYIAVVRATSSSMQFMIIASLAGIPEASVLHSTANMMVLKSILVNPLPSTGKASPYQRKHEVLTMAHLSSLTPNLSSLPSSPATLP